MSITRGFHFESNELVTAEKLHQLVDSASITDLTPDEFSGEVHGLSTSTPASIRDGDILYLHETSVSLTRPTGLSLWLQPTYFVHYNGQWVSLFGGDHLETGRFFNDSVGGTINRGDQVQFEGQTGSGAVTLTINLTGTAVGKAMTFGGNHGGSVAVGAVSRVRIIGHGLFTGSSKFAGSVWMDVLYHIGASGAWATNSGVSDASGFNAMRLNSTSDGDSDTARLQPAYHLGALNFRV